MPIRMYGADWCGDCRRAKQLLDECQLPYEFVDVDADTAKGRAGRAVVQGHNDGMNVIPTLVFNDGSILVEPSNAQLAAKLGLDTNAARGRRPD